MTSDESLDRCARRSLAEQTGLEEVYLEQLYTFVDPQREPGATAVSVAHLALAPADRLEGFEPKIGGAWWEASGLPDLHPGHGRTIDAARDRLAAKLEYSTIAFQLMPEYFTLSDLQIVYESIHEKPVDKRNFRRRVLALDHVQATDRKRRNGSHRPARLYRYTARDALQFLK